MKNLLLATTALVALSSPLFAADLGARRAPLAPQPLPVLSWAGFYTGAQVGYVWGQDSLTQTNGASTFFTGKMKPKAFAGGVHVGYQLQSRDFVYGLEGDYELSKLSGSTKQVFFGEDYYRSVKSTYRASLRARLGMAFGPALIYATGGAAFANFKTQASSVYWSSTQSSTGTRTGWTAGVGAEYMFAPNWSARVEYRYTDFGSFSRSANGGLSASSVAKYEAKDHAVRVGISYHW
ncbi:MAG: hypothetical protein JWN07_1483 [Hyphomicrobiales bacterium]|nr:hypothetical protein [Hyphomicrobiales bacterium]